MTPLEEYYNKFNEDKRLSSRHGRVEYTITMKYIHDYLKAGDRVADIGAGTGNYAIPLFNEGYDVTAVELVQHNLGRIHQKCPDITAFKGNALKLKKLQDDSFDVTLLLGPMYHLNDREDKLKALLEAKRITKPGGYIFAAYIMNEYALMTYGIKEGNFLSSIGSGAIDKNYHVVSTGDDLYSFVRLEDVKSLNEEAGLARVKILSPDGPANHMRQYINALSEEAFEAFMEYQLFVCERPDLLGAGGHIVDVLQKKLEI